MNRTHFEHAGFALLMMAAVWALLVLLGWPAGQWVGAVAAVAFFAGRECAQNEYKVAMMRGVSILSLRWYAGLMVWRWSRDSLFDLLAPVVVCVAAAWWVPRLLF